MADDASKHKRNIFINIRYLISLHSTMCVSFITMHVMNLMYSATFVTIVKPMLLLKQVHVLFIYGFLSTNIQYLSDKPGPYYKTN